LTYDLKKKIFLFNLRWFLFFNLFCQAALAGTPDTILNRGDCLVSDLRGKSIQSSIIIRLAVGFFWTTFTKAKDSIPPLMRVYKD
jgi:hypothetical protein